MKKQTVIKTESFTLSDTLECGQCFRFSKTDELSYSGVALGRQIHLLQEGENLIINGIGIEEYESDYKTYFSFDMDYPGIKEVLSYDPTLKKILNFAPGIRVLRQPLFETLISFILSQNNNIKRIQGLVERLSSSFGEDKGGYFDFPKPSKLAGLIPSDLSSVRCGFRDKYVIDAARQWENKEIDLEIVYHAPLPEARAELMKIHGVGPKVADCTLLFGAARFDAFPEDVWIKRAMKNCSRTDFPNPLSRSQELPNSIFSIMQETIRPTDQKGNQND